MARLTQYENTENLLIKAISRDKPKLVTASIIRKKQQAVPFVPFDFLLAGEKRIHVPSEH